MADIETFNFSDIRRNVPVTVLADSMRALAEYLTDEGRVDLAAGFVREAQVTIAPLVVDPAILEAACAYCTKRGEPGIADALRERFLIRG